MFLYCRFVSLNLVVLLKVVPLEVVLLKVVLLKVVPLEVVLLKVQCSTTLKSM